MRRSTRLRIRIASTFLAAAVVGLSAGCTTENTVAPEENPLPSVFELTPGFIVLGQTTAAITVTGEDFVAQSVVRVDGADRPTAFVNPTTLTFTPTAGDLSGAGTLSVTVTNPAPGGGTSGTLVLGVGYLAPTVTGLAPTNMLVGAAPPEIVVTGTGFHENSVILLNATTIEPTFISATELRVTPPSLLLSAATVLTLRVRQPSGVQTVGNAFEVRNRVPVITSLTPDSVVRGALATPVRVRGHNFVNGSVLLLDGAARATTFVDSTTLQMTLSSNEVATVGTRVLRASNPAPGGGPSDPMDVRIVVPAPTINTLTPASVAVGAAAQTLTVTGADFPSDAVISINGVDRATTVISGSSASIQMEASDFSSAGAIAVRVRAPARNAVSIASTLTVLPPSPSLGTPVVVNLVNNHIIADPTRPVLYASIPGTAASYANRLLKLDAVTGAVIDSLVVGSEPARMAIAANGEFLYVALNGSNAVARIRLSTFQKEIDLLLPDGGLSSTRAEDLEVLPGSSTRLAVSLRNLGFSPRHEGVVLFSGDTRLPTKTQGHTGSNRLAVGTTNEYLFGFNNETTEFGMRRIAVADDGLREVLTVGTSGNFNSDIEHSGTRIWSTQGTVYNDATFAPVGTLPSAGPLRPDVPLGRVHVLVGSEIRTYQHQTFSLIGTATVPDAAGLNTVIRVGTDGLAFGSGSRIVIVRGSLVGP
ncbi:MAG: IPT/TIG domain-containing protein [Gemmatimonadaceae bacterium]|nr:IPT/TIG domain-containing protein [Gemmatimonadaceae bacterium]